MKLDNITVFGTGSALTEFISEPIPYNLYYSPIFDEALWVEASNVGSSKYCYRYTWFVQADGENIGEATVEIKTLSTTAVSIRIFLYKASSGYLYNGSFHTVNLKDIQFLRVAFWTQFNESGLCYCAAIKMYDDEYLINLVDGSGEFLDEPVTANTLYIDPTYVNPGHITIRMTRIRYYHLMSSSDKVVGYFGPFRYFKLQDTTDTDYTKSGFNFPDNWNEYTPINTPELSLSNYSPNQLYKIDYRSEIGELTTNLAIANAQIDALQALLDATSDPTGSTTDGVNSNYSPGVTTNYFESALTTALSEITSQMSGTLTATTYHANLSAPFNVFNGVFDTIGAVLIALLKNATNLTLDAMKRMLTPIGHLLDVCVNVIKNLMSSGEAGNLLDFLVNSFEDLVADKIPDLINFFPSLFPINNINNVVDFLYQILLGNDITTELVSLLTNIVNEGIDSIVNFVSNLMNIVVIIINYLLDITDVGIEWYDLASIWNPMIDYMTDEDDDTVDLALLGTGIGLVKIDEGLFLIPKEVTISWLNLSFDIWDIIFEFWWAFKSWAPWYPIPIIDFSIPTGASYIMLKDMFIPFSDYVVPIKPNPAYFSGRTDGFTLKDLSLDILIAWVLKNVSTLLGEKARQALLYAINKIIAHYKVNLKDIVKRIIDLENTDLKYSDGEITIWDKVVLIETKIDKLSTDFDEMSKLLRLKTAF